MIGSLGSSALDAAYDRWKTASPYDLEKESKCKCERCGLELYPGDKYFDCEGSLLCDECSKEWLSEQSQEVTDEMAFPE